MELANMAKAWDRVRLIAVEELAVMVVAHILRLVHAKIQDACGARKVQGAIIKVMHAILAPHHAAPMHIQQNMEHAIMLIAQADALLTTMVAQADA